MPKLRKLQASDLEQWLQLWNLYLEFYQHGLPDDVKQFTFDRLLFENANMHCAVLEEDGQLIGLVHYIIHASTWTKGSYCYLQDLFVRPEHRGQGGARQLIGHVYQAAETIKCSRVYWLTHQSNAQAITLYDKVADNAGFIQYRQNLPQ